MKQPLIHFVIINIIMIILGFILAYLFVFHQTETNTQVQTVSQCFTNLQPSRYFKGSPSPISTNDIYKQTLISWINDIEIKDFQAMNTGSMRPTIPDYGTVLEINDTSNIQVGDIISFKCDTADKEHYILHRVIAINNGIYITKGDNNPDNDFVAFGCNTTLSDIKRKVVGVLY